MLVGSWTKPNGKVVSFRIVGLGESSFGKISFQVRTPATRNPETHEKHTKVAEWYNFNSKLEKNLFIERGETTIIMERTRDTQRCPIGKIEENWRGGGGWKVDGGGKVGKKGRKRRR